jgi:uncharacterized protein (DUF1684 family)
MRMQRFGRIHFEVAGQTVSLSLFWIMGYGGGVFLPFRDLTSGQAPMAEDVIYWTRLNMPT